MTSGTISTITQAGRASWPGLRVDTDELARYVETRQIVADVLTPAIASDLFLAFACFSGVPGAVQQFHLTYDQLIAATARRFDPSGGLGDELRQRLAESLFVGASDARRIGRYRGRGTLKAWVRTCAKRIALRMARNNGSDMLLARDSLVEEISDVCDQELSLLKSHYGELFRQELLQALNGLAARDRMLLQLHLVAGMSTTRIGKMYHLSQSSISRQVQRAAATTFAVVKERMRQRLGIATAELESLLDMARSRIELTLSSMDDVLADAAHPDA